MIRAAKKGANMLFEIFYDQVPTSLVLDKIIGVCPHQSGMVKSKVFLSGDPDGFNSSEEYSVLSARLYAALEAAEARKLRITAVA